MMMMQRQQEHYQYFLYFRLPIVLTTMKDGIMKTSERGYTPVLAGDGTEHSPSSSRMMEAVAVAVPSAKKEFVEVRAPSSLGPGYELTVNVNGGHWNVLVPDGGVQEGELFRAEVIRKSSSGSSSGDSRNNTTVDPHSIPSGRWRDGLCDCCVLGLCHTHCCMANWCTVIFLGQIMTRMNLTWSANPHVRGTTPKWTTCGILGITVVVLIVTLYSIDIAIFPYPYPDVNTGVVSSDPGVKFWYLVKQCITLTWICFTFVIMCKTRAHIRRTYGIPETTCRGCEDCCCSFFCGCCTVAQMARHTTDYRTYKAACCNRTGMADSTPPTCPHLV